MPFDDTAALVFGRLNAQLEAEGKMIGIKDLQIASIALVNELTLVTHNIKEFEGERGRGCLAISNHLVKRIQELSLEDWEL